MLELKRGGRTRVQTEMVEFIALPFPSSKKKLNILCSVRKSKKTVMSRTAINLPTAFTIV